MQEYPGNQANLSGLTATCPKTQLEDCFRGTAEGGDFLMVRNRLIGGKLWKCSEAVGNASNEVLAFVT